MQTLDIWFVLAVLVYIGVIAGMWRFWHPRDPMTRRVERPVNDAHQPGVPDRLFLLDDETLVQRAEASYYTNRATNQWIGGSAALAGAGWVSGFRRNKPGYSYQEAGTLWLTTRRLVFLGPTVSVSLPLAEILQVEPGDHWLTVWTGRNSHALRWRVQEAETWRTALIDRISHPGSQPG